MFGVIFRSIAIYLWLTCIGILLWRLYVIRNFYETRPGAIVSARMLQIALILLVAGMIAVQLGPYVREVVDTVADALIRLVR